MVTVFVIVVGLEGVVSISCGEKFSLCHSTRGTFGWGDNKFGQIGTSPHHTKLIEKPTPVPILPSYQRHVKAIFCGWTHSTILTGQFHVHSIIHRLV